VGISIDECFGVCDKLKRNKLLWYFVGWILLEANIKDLLKKFWEPHRWNCLYTWNLTEGKYLQRYKRIFLVFFLKKNHISFLLSLMPLGCVATP